MLAERSPFTFTAFYTDLGFELGGTVRPPRFAAAVAAQVRPTGVIVQTRQETVKSMSLGRVLVRSVRSGQQTVALKTIQRRPQIHLLRQSFKFSVERCPTSGVVARVVRHLRRRGSVTEADMVRLLMQWGVSPALRAGFRPGAYPHQFAESAQGIWRLTPWTQLEMPFVGWGNGYVADATRFWLDHRYLPDAQEEWHPEVRERVRHLLTLLDVPPFFAEFHAGAFRQVTPLGLKTYRLDVDRLPDGRYFTLLSPHGDQTFSIEGRAFVVDSPQGISVITPWATQRLKDALLRAEDDPNIRWHPAGLDFKAKVRACQLEVILP